MQSEQQHSGWTASRHQLQQPWRRQRPVCRGFGDNWRQMFNGDRGADSNPGSSSSSGPRGLLPGPQSQQQQGGQPQQQPPQQPSVWSDWQAEMSEQDWEAWEGINVADLDDVAEIAQLRDQVIERRRSRAGKRRKVRDEYLRPIVDAEGILNRLAVDEGEVEERVFTEAITNQYESREAVKFAGILLAIPLAIGFGVSRVVAQPLWAYAERLDPAAFAATDNQKVEGAHELHVEELRLRMQASLGQAPPLTDEQVYQHLRGTALHLNEEFKEANKRAMLNVVSDTTSGIVFFIMLGRQTVQRQILFRTIGRVFTGLSDTAKAFLIILVTDILLGYHSEEGWTATLRLFSGHYGLEAEDEALKIFVATVPVFFDSLFKVWIFVGLNKADPAAAVTLKQMDRH